MQRPLFQSKLKTFLHFHRRDHLVFTLTFLKKLACAITVTEIVR